MTLAQMRLEYARLHRLWSDMDEGEAKDTIWEELQDLMDAMKEAKERG